MKTGIFSILFTLLVSASAQAGWMFEPYLGYQTGDFEIGGTKTETKGAVVGARLGYELALPWFAVDLSSMPSGKGSDDSFGDSDIKKTSVGLVVGVDLPVALRAYAGVGFANTYTEKYDNFELAYKDGKFTKVGLGFTFLPLVSINLEYQMNDYDKLELTGTGIPTLSGTVDDIEYNTIMLAVSLPLSF